MDLSKLEPKYTDHRGISRKVNEVYGVQTLHDGDKEVARVYPYPHADKVRVLPKDFSSNKGFANDHLFGMDKFNAGTSKFITIVEGEEDAPSAYQMLGSTYPVVALPGASTAKKVFKNQKCYDFINAYDNVVVAVDGDKPGEATADVIARTFAHKNVYRVSMTTHKDPNAFLQAGEGNAFKFAWMNRSKYVPEYDTSTPEGFLKLYEEAQDKEYLPSGIKDYDEKALGLVQGCVTIFQAKEGTGKTELFRYFEHHLIKNYPDVPFATCHLEETQVRSLLGLVSYDLGKNVTRKELVDNEEEVLQSIKRISETENFHLFTVGTDEDPEVLIQRIKFYAEVYGCKYVFFEPIQDLAHQRSGTDTTEQFLSKMSVNLARVAAETGVGIITIAHENDDGKIRDCRMLGKQASVVVRLERDGANEDEEVANVTTLTILKNRPAAYQGYAGQVFFNNDTFTLEEYGND